MCEKKVIGDSTSFLNFNFDISIVPRFSYCLADCHFVPLWFFRGIMIGVFEGGLDAH